MTLSPIEKDQLVSYFTYPCEVIHTRGTREGIILKFENAYLKIYDDNNENYYIIEEYFYGNEQPLVTQRVHIRDMRSYASEFCQYLY